jgi:hypothetical protein
MNKQLFASFVTPSRFIISGTSPPVLEGLTGFYSRRREKLAFKNEHRNLECP